MNKKEKYSCNCCGYNTNIKRDYDNHNKSKKHSDILNKSEETKIYECINCNKKFITNGGLWKHKKTCNVEPIPPTTNTPTTQQTTTEPPTINENEIKKYFEKNPEILLNIVKTLIPTQIEQQQLVPYKNNIELVKFDENNLKNEVIEIVKNEVKKVNKRVDKLEQKLNYYTENYCMNNIDYEIFVSELPITHKFCKELSEDFFQLITEMLKKEIKKHGIENSPIYCMLNSKKQIVVKVKMNKIWNTFYHNDPRILSVITEIVKPIIDKIKLGIEEYPDEKIKKKNGFIHHKYLLDDKTQQVGIMRYGLYEQTELNTRKIKRLTEKRQGITGDKNEEDEEDDEEENDEEDDDENDEEDDEEEEEDDDENDEDNEDE